MILCTLEHEIRDICARDRKPEPRQMIFPHAIRSRVGFVSEPGWPNDGPIQPTGCQYMLHLGCIGHEIGEKQPASQIRRRDDRVLEQERHRHSDDALDSRVQHRPRERVCEALQKVGIIFRDGYPWTKARRNGVLSSHYALELAAVQQVAFNNRDSAVKRLQPTAGANECRDLVTVLQPLSNDLLTDTARRAQYKNLHKASGFLMPPKGGMAL